MNGQVADHFLANLLGLVKHLPGRPAAGPDRRAPGVCGQ
jgi:hypothetical protein